MLNPVVVLFLALVAFVVGFASLAESASPWFLAPFCFLILVFFLSLMRGTGSKI